MTPLGWLFCAFWLVYGLVCLGLYLRTDAKLIAERRRTDKLLRKAPMPLRESTLAPDEWDESYDEWWHRHASEQAFVRRKAT